MSHMRYQDQHYGGLSAYPYYHNDLSMAQDDMFMIPDQQPRHSTDRHHSVNFGAYDPGFYQTSRLPQTGFHPIDADEDQYESGSYSTGSPTSTSESRHSPTFKTKRVISSKPVEPDHRHLSSSDKPRCPHPDCDPKFTGKPAKYFSRKADVARHYRSTHERCFLDCPAKRCSRKGANGFTRNDHLIEHRRQYHNEIIQKRPMGGRASRQSPS